MKIIRSKKEMFRLSRALRGRAKRIGLVPTMGALHAGHLSLIRKARKANDYVVVSIFVNPAQFGPKEDFRKYPRKLKSDSLLCENSGVDVIFYPDAKKMYPRDFMTYVDVKDLSASLCGKFRPGHFRGVATIVTKLFNIVSPHTAYFGQKDAQQAIIIKRMVEDLDIPVKIDVLPIVRDSDGVALSSRNAYLSRDERRDAVVLSQSLNLAKDLIKSGVRDAGKIISAMKRLIRKIKSARVDYISAVDLRNLKPIKKINPVRNHNIKGKGKISNGVNKNCLIALAVCIGKTRLIDNVIIGEL